MSKAGKRELTQKAKAAIFSTLVNTGEPFKFANDDPDESPELDPALTAEIETQINRVLAFLGYSPVESGEIAKGLI